MENGFTNCFRCGQLHGGNYVECDNCLAGGPEAVKQIAARKAAAEGARAAGVEAKSAEG